MEFNTNYKYCFYSFQLRTHTNTHKHSYASTRKSKLIMFVLVGRSICRSVGRSVILSLKGGKFNSHAPIRALYYKCESDLRIEHIFQTQLFLSPLDATPPLFKSKIKNGWDWVRIGKARHGQRKIGNRRY